MLTSDIKQKKNKIKIVNDNIIINNNEKIFFELNNDLNNSFLEDNDDSLEKELEYQLKKNLPTNYGNKWTEEEKSILIDMLKNTPKFPLEDFNQNDNNLTKDQVIKQIADKLCRTEGGIKGEIKKIIMDKYMKGEDPEYISKDLNLIYKNVKSIIKIYLDKESESDINILEKENKLLKLKIENISLRKSLKELLR